MTASRAREILAMAEARPAVGEAGVRIIAIDGPAGSGKTTLALELRDAVRARHGITPPLVGVDDFVGWTDLDPTARSWWPRWEAEVLAPLLAGQPLRWRRRDWWGDSDGAGLLPEPARAEWAPIAILEGVSVTRRAAAGRLALAVWVETDPGVRLARGLARDGEAERAHWQLWQTIESAFFAADGTRGRADLVVRT